MVSGAAFEQDEFITNYSPFPGMTEERMKGGRDLGREKERSMDIVLGMKEVKKREKRKY